MSPEVLKPLHDIDEACGLIEQFVAGKTVDDWRRDVQLRSAVERQFITIGESLQQAPEMDKSISDTRRIINFRNVMVHGYAQIVPDTVWGVVEKDLPVLHGEVRRLVTGSSPSSPSVGG